ncbi:Pleckstrin homology domain-containing family G member 5 [Taenia solium]|eukprot:TsM_000827200 transcript=TsM_000827200 gene=TsM_000827200
MQRNAAYAVRLFLCVCGRFIPNLGESVFMSTKATPLWKSRGYDSEMILEDGNANTNPDFWEPLPSPTDVNSPSSRYRTRTSKPVTPERSLLNNGAYFEQTSVPKSSIRQRMGQMLARSTPDINAEYTPLAAAHADKLRSRLKAYENGNLPKIPQELLALFPQNLQRHDFTVIERIWNQLTSAEKQDTDVNSNNASKKTKDQQLSAIVELLYTEACYIKTLEMLIDVHIAVYLDLTKSTTWSHDYASRSGSLNRLGMLHSTDPIAPTELAPTTSTASTSRLGMHRRIRGRGSHDFTSSSSSLSNLSTFSLSDYPGFAAPPFEDVFGNIGTIYEVNHQFWTDYFEPGIINDSTIDVKFCIRNMKKAFSQFKSYFHPYIDFLETYGTLISNIKYLDENNKFFSIYHEWTKSNNPLNSRESLSGLLAQPFQRLTRYGILIRRIKEATTDEYEISALTEMLAAVEDFVKEVDVNQPEQESGTKMNDFIQRIHKYAIVDSLRSDFNTELPMPLADIGTFLRQPMRIKGRSRTRKPIAEVRVKVKYAGGKISDALCVLLSDMILICKHTPLRKHISVHRPPILLSHLTIQQKKDDPNSFVGFVTNDLGLVVDAYLFSSDGKDLEEWICRVQQQKAEMGTMQRPNSVNRDWQHRSSTLSSLDGLPPRRCDYHRMTSYDSHWHITNCGMKRNSEALQRAFFNESSATPMSAIGRLQQPMDGLAFRSTNLRHVPPTATSEGEYALTERIRSGGSSMVSKSTSSASDSSASSSSTNTTTNTTTTSMSGESLDSTRSFSPAAGTPKVKYSPKRAVNPGSIELVKTDSTDKRLTR